MKDRFRRFAAASVASAVTGVVVADVAYLAAYQSLHDEYGFRMEEYATRSLLNGVERAIEDHRKAVGRLPASLSDVEEIKGWRRIDRGVDPNGCGEARLYFSIDRGIRCKPGPFHRR